MMIILIILAIIFNIVFIFLTPMLLIILGINIFFLSIFIYLYFNERRRIESKLLRLTNLFSSISAENKEFDFTLKDGVDEAYIYFGDNKNQLNQNIKQYKEVIPLTTLKDVEQKENADFSLKKCYLQDDLNDFFQSLVVSTASRGIKAKTVIGPTIPKIVMCDKNIIFSSILNINNYISGISKKDNTITFGAILLKHIDKKSEVLFQIISTKLSETKKDIILSNLKKVLENLEKVDSKLDVISSQNTTIQFSVVFDCNIVEPKVLKKVVDILIYKKNKLESKLISTILKDKKIISIDNSTKLVEYKSEYIFVDKYNFDENIVKQESKVVVFCTKKENLKDVYLEFENKTNLSRLSELL